jgi:hypothetical protein
MIEYDVVIMTDLRFPGGNSASTLEEIRIQHSHGLKTGLYHRPSLALGNTHRPFHKGITEAILQGQCKLLNFDQNIRTKLLIVRHPSLIRPPLSVMPNIETGRVVMVINHPPINADGRIDYILPFIAKTLRETYKCEPMLYPIGPLIRKAILEYYGDSVTLQEADWSNIFDLNRFGSLGPRAAPQQRFLRIGRHSRPGREKWPETEEDICAAYLVDSEHSVVILGGAEAPEAILGYRPKNWMVHTFGSMDVVRFLNSIDVFVYFHHPHWVEAFGRVIAEAMASGLPTILPHHFRPLFREGAIYASPKDVRKIVRELTNVEAYQEASRRAHRFVRVNFDSEVHIRRLMRLCPMIRNGGFKERA